jgi:ligand-binding sensor domain-containing protein
MYVDSKNRLWVGSLAGVSVFEGETIIDYSYSDGLVYDRVDAISEDQTGMMWFGTQYGASSFDGTVWKSYTTENGLPDNWITGITVDADTNIWFGTKSRGIAELIRVVK